MPACDPKRKSSYFENVNDAHLSCLSNWSPRLSRAISHSPSCGHALVKTAFSVWFVDILEVRPSHIE